MYMTPWEVDKDEVEAERQDKVDEKVMSELHLRISNTVLSNMTNHALTISRKRMSRTDTNCEQP